MIGRIFGCLGILAGLFLVFLFRRTWKWIEKMDEREYEESYYDIIISQEVLLLLGLGLIIVGTLMLL